MSRARCFAGRPYSRAASRRPKSLSSGTPVVSGSSSKAFHTAGSRLSHSYPVASSAAHAAFSGAGFRERGVRSAEPDRMTASKASACSFTSICARNDPQECPRSTSGRSGSRRG